MLNVRGDLLQETWVGVFVLPLVPHNTPCQVVVPLEVRGNLISLECLSSYGDLVRRPDPGWGEQSGRSRGWEGGGEGQLTNIARLPPLWKPCGEPLRTCVR